ncbi:MAG: hypothetical protein ACYS8X_11615 [Planctomycetota bacterium]|jgi:hypothetical protein
MDATSRNHQAASTNDHCSAGCSGCRLDYVDGGLHGWRLGLSAVAVFLVPLLAAIVGAAVSPADMEPVGCLAGAALGAGGMSLAARIVRRRAARREIQ